MRVDGMGRWTAALGMAATLAAADVAAAFAIFDPVFGGTGIDTRQSLAETRRWAGARLDDGIQVGVSESFLVPLGVTDPVLADLVWGAVADSFGAWESPALQFDITFGAPENGGSGFEIFLETPGPDLCGVRGGCAFVDAVWSPQRRLSNGWIVPGYEITEASIVLVAETYRVLLAVAPFSGAIPLLTNILMHEIGHTIGLFHPGDGVTFPGDLNFDTDTDPFNPIPVDPADPFGGFLLSPAYDCEAIMDPSRPPCSALAFAETELHFDDIGGRDVLYPLAAPEPGAAWLLGPVLALAALGRRRRSHSAAAS